MSDLDKRRDAYENRFAHDAEMRFKAEARCCKKVGLWAAELMNIGGETANVYAKEVIAANLEEAGYDDVKRKLIADFENKGVEVSEHAIDVAIDRYNKEAIDELSSES